MFASKTSTSRRTLLKAAASSLMTGGFASMLPRAARALPLEPGKVLTVYYSRTGNTRAVAEHIRELAGGDLAEIKAAHAYPEDYRATTDQAKRELEANLRPALASDVADIGPYGTVFVGFPNWWGTMPMAMFAFLERHDFSGKTIVPFCTHEGSALGRSIADIRALCPKSTIGQGLALRGGSGGYARGAAAGREIDAWVRGLNLASAG